MSVTIKYKGNTIASANTDTTKTLQTSGKYCEADIVVENVQDGGITPSGSITLTEERSYDVTDKAQAIVDFSTTRANLAEAVTAKGVDTLPTSSFDTIATNIGLISGGGSLPSSISKIDGGSFTVASTTNAPNLPIYHNLGVEPKGFIVWSDPLMGSNSSLNCAIATNYAIATSDLTNVKSAGGILYSKGWSGYSGYNYLFDVKSEYFTSTYIKVYITSNYLTSCTYYWLAWA